MVPRRQHVVRHVWRISSACFLIAASGQCRPARESTATSATVPDTKRLAPAPQASAAMPTFRLAAEGLPDEGMWKCHPAIADINGDGFPDIAAIARKGDGPRVWLGDGTGRWRDASEGLDRGRSCGGGIAVADVNNDGANDLAVADHCFGVRIFLGNGHGEWTPIETNIDDFKPADERTAGDPYAAGAEDIAVGDFDNDGLNDLVVGASGRGGIRAYRNAGDARHWIAMSAGLPQEGFANTVLFADINHDEWPDIVAAHEEGPRVWLGNGGSYWQAASDGLPVPSVGGLYYQVALGDVNEDTRVDIAAANWVDGAELYLQSADGHWEKQADVFPDLQGGAIGIGLADLDGDDHLDLAVTGREALVVGTVFGIFILQGDGSGAFERRFGTGIPETGLSTTWCVESGDINLDGVDDLVAATGGVVASSAADASPIVKRLQVWCFSGTDTTKMVARKD